MTLLWLEIKPLIGKMNSHIFLRKVVLMVAVIGNPPYVDNRGFDKKELHYLYENYSSSFQKSGTDKFKTTKLNLIAPFIELNSKILKNNGVISYIFHKNIFKTNSYTGISKFIF